MNQYKFDMYSVLNVGRDATQSEIKQAYIRQAKKFHPDTNFNLSPLEKKLRENTMYKINEAYSILSNPKERVRYDIITQSVVLAKVQVVKKRQPQRWNNPVIKSVNLENLVSLTGNLVSNVAKIVSEQKKLYSEFMRTVRDLYEEEISNKGRNVDKKA